MLHLHNPNIPTQEPKLFLGEPKMVFPLRPSRISEEPQDQKTKSFMAKTIHSTSKSGLKKAKRPETLFNLKFEKENVGELISPIQKPRHQKTNHRSMAGESDFRIKSNNVKMQIEEKEQEISLKSFVKGVMPEKNPTLLFNKFLENVKMESCQKEIFPIPVQRNEFGINEEYFSLYGEEYEKKLYQEELDFSEVLRNTRITDGLRAKMVDWMLEIFAKYPDVTSHHTYFRALSIFHLYIKNCYEKTSRILTDSDIHLTGIASMFLASKYEDESHIQLKDFVNLIGHSAFSPAQIKDREWEIYSVLEMNITFPTSYTFLNFYYYRCFGGIDWSNVSRSLYETALYILKLCGYSFALVEYKPHTLAICSLFYAIKLIFEALEEVDNFNQNEVENNMIERLFYVQDVISMTEFKSCLEKIRWLFANWDSLYTRKMNIQRPEYELRGIY